MLRENPEHANHKPKATFFPIGCVAITIGFALVAHHEPTVRIVGFPIPGSLSGAIIFPGRRGASATEICSPGGGITGHSNCTAGAPGRERAHRSANRADRALQTLDCRIPAPRGCQDKRWKSDLGFFCRPTQPPKFTPSIPFFIPGFPAPRSGAAVQPQARHQESASRILRGAAASEIAQELPVVRFEKKISFKRKGPSTIVPEPGFY